jgi:hypothetical protein
MRQSGDIGGESCAEHGDVLQADRGGTTSIPLVIASEAKQSIGPHARKHGLLRRYRSAAQ